MEIIFTNYESIYIFYYLFIFCKKSFIEPILFQLLIIILQLFDNLKLFMFKAYFLRNSKTNAQNHIKNIKR